jgi:hypothetical protein
MVNYIKEQRRAKGLPSYDDQSSNQRSDTSGQQPEVETVTH